MATAMVPRDIRANLRPIMVPNVMGWDGRHRLGSVSGTGAIDDIHGRMKRQRARLLAGKANDLAPCHDYIFNDLTRGKDDRNPVGTHAHFGKRLDFGPQPLRKDVSLSSVQ